MKRVFLMLGTVLLIAGLALSWKGYEMGGQEVATVHLFGQLFGGSVQVYAPTAGWFGRPLVRVRSGTETVIDQIEIVGFGSEPEPTLLPRNAEFVFPANSAVSCLVEPFHTLDIDLELGNVVVWSGDDDYSVFVDCQCSDHAVSCTVQDGVLSLWNSGDGVGLNPAQHGCDIIICVPSDRALNELDAAVDLGSVTLSGLTLKTANLNLNLGSLTGENLTVLGDLVASVDLGSVDLEGDLAGVTDISADLGSVTLFLLRPASDYSWVLTADLGSITVGGRDQSSHSGRVTAGRGDIPLTVQASLGSITLDFAEADTVTVTEK